MPVTRGQSAGKEKLKEITVKIAKLIEKEKSNAGIDADENKRRCFLESAIVGFGSLVLDPERQPGRTETKKQSSKAKPREKSPEKKERKKKIIASSSESGPNSTKNEPVPQPSHGRNLRKRPGREPAQR